jgi:peptidoglycan/LPS O-acetylase OafA/YrhL
VGLAFALLICLLHRRDRAISQSRLLSPISWCGVMCYSIYLVHYPVEKVIAHLMYRNGFTSVWQTVTVTVPLAIIPSIAIAAVFYHYIERHFLNTIPVRAHADSHRTPNATATLDADAELAEPAAT